SQVFGQPPIHPGPGLLKGPLVQEQNQLLKGRFKAFPAFVIKRFPYDPLDLKDIDNFSPAAFKVGEGMYVAGLDIQAKRREKAAENRKLGKVVERHHGDLKFSFLQG